MTRKQETTLSMVIKAVYSPFAALRDLVIKKINVGYPAGILLPQKIKMTIDTHTIYTDYFIIE